MDRNTPTGAKPVAPFGFDPTSTHSTPPQPPMSVPVRGLVPSAEATNAAAAALAYLNELQSLGGELSPMSTPAMGSEFPPSTPQAQGPPMLVTPTAATSSTQQAVLEALARGSPLANRGDSTQNNLLSRKPILPINVTLGNAGANFEPQKYKTQLCRNLLRTGSCQFGETCVFAHSRMEMRAEGSLPITPLYSPGTQEMVLAAKLPLALSEPRLDSPSQHQPPLLAHLLHHHHQHHQQHVSPQAARASASTSSTSASIVPPALAQYNNNQAHPLPHLARASSGGVGNHPNSNHSSSAPGLPSLADLTTLVQSLAARVEYLELEVVLLKRQLAQQQQPNAAPSATDSTQ